MKKKIIPIIETTFLLCLAWAFTYHYNLYLSTPRFQLNDEKLYDSYRVIVDILIWTALFLRVFRLLKRGLNPIKGRIRKVDLAIFVGYTILIIPDLWLFTKWFYFGNMYGIYILFFLSPWIFWFIEINLSFSELSKPEKLKKIGRISLGVFLIVGITWIYLVSLKLGIEEKQKDETISEVKTHPNKGS